MTGNWFLHTIKTENDAAGAYKPCTAKTYRNHPVPAFFTFSEKRISIHSFL